VPVIAEAGSVRLIDGTLAGSTLTMDAAVRHAVDQVGLPLMQVATAAATTPARLLGIADRTGSITAGKAADLVILNEDLHVAAVLADGAVIHGTLPGRTEQTSDGR
jgi:N-acetylglucosamine-6-phosphate deacetylase